MGFARTFRVCRASEHLEVSFTRLGQRVCVLEGLAEGPLSLICSKLLGKAHLWPTLLPSVFNP